jgi:hypothetical protein
VGYPDADYKCPIGYSDVYVSILPVAALMRCCFDQEGGKLASQITRQGIQVLDLPSHKTFQFVLSFIEKYLLGFEIKERLRYVV